MAELSLEERVAQLERLLGVGEGAAPGHRQGEAPGDGPGKRAGGQARGWDFSRWLRAQRRPGQALVAVGVALGRNKHSTVIQRGDADRDFDLRPVAELCQALASEARLSLLQQLLRGQKTTSELIAATRVDRGQLYHHLRDLFVQGLVGQPARGRYEATARGQMVFLAAQTLSSLGDPHERVSPDFKLEEPGEAPADDRPTEG
jgi:DNA-binding transcriptional ArsR family regulator